MAAKSPMPAPSLSATDDDSEIAAPVADHSGKLPITEAVLGRAHDFRMERRREPRGPGTRHPKVFF